MIVLLIIMKLKTSGSLFLTYQIYLINSETSLEIWMRLAFFNLNKLGGIIRAHKDILPNNSKKNVVYQIVCKDCDASYVMHPMLKQIIANQSLRT